MPTELRHIIFSAAEVTEALGLFSRAQGRTLPCGTTIEAALVGAAAADPIVFRMVVAPDATRGRTATGPVRLEWSGPELAAALVHYCRSRSIPVPARGSKSLQRFGTSLGLIVTMVPRNSTLPARLGQR